jgi:[ribosomal protein S18]-alanine N-acetyltransferase
MNVRRPKSSDREQLAELLRQFDAYNKSGGGVTPEIAVFEEDTNKDIWPLEYGDDIINGPEYFGFVAEEGGQIIGFIVGSIREREDYVMNKEGYVEDFFVVEAKRGQGLGTQLFDTLVADLKTRGATHLALDAYVANQPAIDLYHKWGFVDSEVVMRRRLDV